MSKSTSEIYGRLRRPTVPHAPRAFEADKAAAELKAEETRITNHIIDNLDKRSETGAAGKHHRVQVVRKKKYRVTREVGLLLQVGREESTL
jgi:hypothetical protein